ncbi:hypothetical protein ACFVHW_19415 [Streptomyces sp. NPDC127110]|uniref:hypothetical protein n=1 Tax=Streptomyces sp. NPDC127110 TaxID=3345362 RepID=UPI00364448B7
MPRRRPGALRAEAPSPRLWGPAPPPRIHGLSAGTSLAVHRAERLSDDFLYPGATARALRCYQEFLAVPGRRPLYPQEAECSCSGCAFDDVRHARDVLEEVSQELRPRARAELLRLLRPLDATFFRRTLPDPFTHRRTRRVDFWWYRRLADRW